MEKKHLIVCVRHDIEPVFRDYFATDRKAGELYDFFYCDHTKNIKSHFINIARPDYHLVIDAVIDSEGTMDFITEIKNEHPLLRIMLIGSAEIKKEKLVELIRNRSLNAVLMRPFTLNDLSEKIALLYGPHHDK